MSALSLAASPVLPLPPVFAHPRRRSLGAMALDSGELSRFNDLLAAINEEAPAIDGDQFLTLARWLQEQPRTEAGALLSASLARAGDLQRMLQDPDWELSPTLRQRALLLLDYLRCADDLIPDAVPLFGQLDDALLVQLCWNAFAGEAQDYADYCRFRSHHRPRGSAEERRLAWEADVLRQANELLQRRHARDAHYAQPWTHGALLRVC